MKVSIDDSKCIGCGACSVSAPEVFSEPAEGKARVKAIDDEVIQKNEKKIKEAVSGCPVQAITL